VIWFQNILEVKRVILSAFESVLRESIFYFCLNKKLAHSDLLLFAKKVLGVELRNIEIQKTQDHRKSTLEVRMFCGGPQKCWGMKERTEGWLGQ
jgi:hypothetical protein